MRACEAAEGTGLSRLIRIVIALLLLVVPGIPLSTVTARLEKRYNIDTMREVKAFLDGADPDQIERNRKMPAGIRIAIQMLAAAAGAIVFMSIVSLIVGLTMFN